MLDIVETLGVPGEIAKLISACEYLGRKIEKEEFEVHIDALMVLLDDLFHLKLDAPEESLTNEDIAERLKRVSEKLRIEQINGWAERIEEIFRAMPRNVNRQLAMESLLICS